MYSLETDELTELVTNMTPVGKTIIRHVKTNAVGYIESVGYLPAKGFDDKLRAKYLIMEYDQGLSHFMPHLLHDLSEYIVLGN